ncbi:MAG: rhodanese-like domain-containing protein [Vicinamibacteria bacterium]|jgi:rhodanese-related sulfurtransferase
MFGVFDSPPVDREGLRRWIADRYADVPFIDGDALASWLADRSRPAPVVVDVRSPKERGVSMLPGAIGANDGAAAAAALSTLDPSVPIVVYCAGGLRSAKAARVLIAAGHGDVHNLEGGIFAWANADRPVQCEGRTTRYVHPSDDKWGALLARDRHAWTPTPE